MALHTVTMNPFDYDKAWEQRFDIPVKVGTIVTLDAKHTYRITHIKTPEPAYALYRENWYTMMPVGETLEAYKRQWDDMAKHNSRMTAGGYPDFSICVESLWFFSRNVTWEE